MDPGHAGPVVAGADGCRGGWLVALASSGRRALSAERYFDLEPVFARLAAGELAALAVDIPIGLSGVGPRRCDAEARRLLGPRRSSVFPAPARDTLGASCHAQASALNQQAGGKRLSIQSFLCSGA
jgi:predicted RNase H-like nuclease